MIRNGNGGGVHIMPVADYTLTENRLMQVRQVLYRFLGSLFMYPTAERLSTIRAVTAALQQDEALWAQLPFGAAVSSLLAHIANLDEEIRLPLEEEYSRLFQVKPLAVPCESFYADREGLARGLIVANLAGEYLEAGLELAERIVESPDHIAVEMEFMAFLCDQEAQAAACAAAAAYRDRQRQFLNKHLRRWFPTFARQAIAAEPAHLYRLSIEATFAFLTYELIAFGLHLTSQRNGPPAS